MTGPMVQVRAQDLAELRGVVLAVRSLPKDLRNEINRQHRANLSPIWKESVAQKLNGQPNVDKIILGKGARVKAGNPSNIIGGNSTRALSGGLVPTRWSKSWEFGAHDRERKKTYTRKNRRNGGTHTVSRRTRRQLPAQARQGRVIWPAAAETVPRLVSLEVQTVVRLINERLGN